MRLLFLLIFFCNSSFATYTTMTIDAVQEANGVWTAAGVMDTAGFVRTTGAVSVMGATRSLPVAMKYAPLRLGTMVGGAARLAGPVGWAASIGLWLAEDGITSSGDKYVSSPLPGSKGYVVQSYCGVSSGGGICDYPYSAPCAGDGVGQYGTSMFYMGNQRYNGYFCRIQYTSQDPLAWYSTPTDQQWQHAINRPIGLPAAFDAMKHPSMVGKPIPIESVSFTPFSEWYGSPYFKDGNWYRDRMDVSPCPTSSQPTRVCVDLGPQKFDGATDPQTVPSQATGTASGGAPKEQEKDFCKLNPKSIACAELGELKDQPFDPIEKPFRITPHSPWGADNAQCPAPKVMTLATGGTYTMSYQPTCDFFSGIRPAVIALAFLVALYIALGIPTGKGD